jgi:DNA-binding transcriptional ArsR family regulator
MSVLPELLSSRTRAEVLRILFGLELKEVHLRDIARRSGFTVGTIQTEVKKLRKLDLICLRRDGNRLYCRANSGHPLFSILRDLVLKTNGLAELLKKHLLDPAIHIAFVYGPVAEGRETGASAIDLFIVGTVHLRAAAAKLTGVADEVGRDVNPFIIDPDEFRNRLAKKDPFVSQVVESAKIYIVGGQPELEVLGSESHSI